MKKILQEIKERVWDNAESTVIGCFVIFFTYLLHEKTITSGEWMQLIGLIGGTVAVWFKKKKEVK